MLQRVLINFCYTNLQERAEEGKKSDGQRRGKREKISSLNWNASSSWQNEMAFFKLVKLDNFEIIEREGENVNTTITTDLKYLFLI